MALAQIGLFTGVLEALAAAVGAGMVIGGFLAGLYGLLAGWNRHDLRAEALDAGYVGGAAGAIAAVIDLFVRYVV